MDIAQALRGRHDVVTCIDMHTTGESARIILDGYPKTLSGTLLEQRATALRDHDHIRRKLMLEPRGHADCYGAALRQDTEHTASGKAHMGVLFLHNEGLSTMCGHATIALGRFLIDTHDPDVFPRRNHVQFNAETKLATLNLHAPCGIVEVTVPTNSDGTKSDPTRPVSHISVPCFATGINVDIQVPNQHKWTELGQRTKVTVDFSFGGAFFCLISAHELGFPGGLKADIDLAAMKDATRKLKSAINGAAHCRRYVSHPEHDELEFLYSIIVTDTSVGVPIAHSSLAETGVCFFGDQQIDRSPTGSGVAARVALAYAKDRKSYDTVATYHSLVSRSLGGKGGFIGSVYEELSAEGRFPVIRVKIEGHAFYTGTSSFVVESDDILGDDGFLFERLC